MCKVFKKDRFQIVREVAITWYPLSIHLRSVNDKVAITWYPLSIHLRPVNDKVKKEQKSDKKHGKDYMKSTRTS